MIVVNLSHLLTLTQLEQIETITGQEVDRVVEFNVQINPRQPIAPQVASMVDRAGLSPHEWQTVRLLVVPPSLNFNAVALFC